VLSNSIWSMPQSTRAGVAGEATVFYRCGSQQGKPAATVPEDTTGEELTRLTVEFVTAQIELFRAAQASKQKNAARNLKKYFDVSDIHLIEQAAQDDALALATRIVGG
jgi:hypothetical protein